MKFPERCPCCPPNIVVKAKYFAVLLISNKASAEIFFSLNNISVEQAIAVGLDAVSKAFIPIATLESPEIIPTAEDFPTAVLFSPPTLGDDNFENDLEPIFTMDSSGNAVPAMDKEEVKTKVQQGHFIL